MHCVQILNVGASGRKTYLKWGRKVKWGRKGLEQQFLAWDSNQLLLLNNQRHAIHRMCRNARLSPWGCGCLGTALPDN